MTCLRMTACALLTLLCTPTLLFGQPESDYALELAAETDNRIHVDLEMLLATLPVEDPQLLEAFATALQNLDLAIQKTASCSATAQFTASPSHGCGPMTVTFDASGSHCGGQGCNLSLYLFDPGDGSAPTWKSGSSWQHTYGHGTFSARLHILCSDGSLSAVQSVAIDATAPVPGISSLSFANNTHPQFVWQSMPGAIQYQVQRKIGVGTFVTVYSGSATSFTDEVRINPALTTPSSGHEITFYRVKAVYANCHSAYSHDSLWNIKTKQSTGPFLPKH